MTSLEGAINEEPDIDDASKQHQIGLLSSGAKQLTQEQLESIIEGNIQPFDQVSLQDIHGVRELIKWRIRNDLPILPFDDLKDTLNPQPLLF